jgi:hypothetical protein
LISYSLFVSCLDEKLKKCLLSINAHGNYNAPSEVILFQFVLCSRLEKGVPRKAINKITLVQEEKAFFVVVGTTI